MNVDTATSSQLSLNEIIRPYLLPDEGSDFPFYNSELQAKIEQIQTLITGMDGEEEELAAIWVRKLKNHILTNNHFVSYQKEKNPKFSIHFCALTNDAAGLKFLLRTGASPNELKNGKAPIHIAASRAFAEIAKVLKQCPYLDLDIRTLSGKTAIQLTKNLEIQSILYPELFSIK